MEVIFFSMMSTYMFSSYGMKIIAMIVQAFIEVKIG